MTPNDASGDPFDDAAEPEIEDIEVEEPGLEEADSVEAGKTPASVALSGEPSDRRAVLLDLANRLDIRSDDPAWLLVRAALDAHQAASVATQATEKLIDVPSAIEKAALDGASRAAGEIQQHAAVGAETIVGSLAGEIESAAARPLAKLLKPYVNAISEQAGEITKSLRFGEEDRIRANADEFLRRVSKRIDSHATATKTAGRISAIVLLALGAAIGVAGAKLTHHWSPVPIRQAPGGGFSVEVPPGHSGQFKPCGSDQACAFIYPSHQGGRGSAS